MVKVLVVKFICKVQIYPFLPSFAAEAKKNLNFLNNAKKKKRRSKEVKILFNQKQKMSNFLETYTIISINRSQTIIYNMKSIAHLLLISSLAVISTQAFVVSNVKRNRLITINHLPTTTSANKAIITFQLWMGRSQDDDQHTESDSQQPNVSIEKQDTNDSEMQVNEFDKENLFIPNKPIELDSLRPQTTFLGLEPKDDKTRQLDSELPLFTSTIVLGMSVYFIYLALFGEDVLLNPSMPLAF